MEKKMFKKMFFWIVISFFLLVLALFLIRAFSHKELDDVTPGINCKQDLLEKADVLWIIPNYENISISQNEEWCNYILEFNKTLGMHGVNHEYNEFKIDRNQSYLENGINMFEDCFKFKPEMFKAPQLNISKDNKKLINDNGLELKNYLNQIFHKAYHCNDSDFIKNSFVDVF